MMKSIKAMLKRSKERYRVPRCVRDVIPVQAMWKDGIFRVGNRYSMTFSFTDINYQAAGKANQEAMFLSYSELLNSLDSNAVTKLTIFNHALQKIDFEREFLISNYEEELEIYGEEMNRVMRDKTINAGRVLRTLLLTVTVERKNIEEARAYFTRVGTELKTHFSALGSTCTPMDAEARLRIFHNFYRKGDEEAFTCNIEEDMRRGHDFRDRIAYPTAITQNVEFLINSVEASTMLSNSEFIVMLNQAPSDRERLAELLNISEQQMGYITNAAPGCGLIRYGGALVPFENHFPKDTKMYQLMTTKPGEGTFGGG